MPCGNRMTWCQYGTASTRARTSAAVRSGMGGFYVVLLLWLVSRWLRAPPPEGPRPCPLSRPLPTPLTGRGEPGWSGLAVLPLLPVRGVGRGREKRAGVMRVLGGGVLAGRIDGQGRLQTWPLLCFSPAGMSADPVVRQHPTPVSPAAVLVRPAPLPDARAIDAADVPDGWTAAASRLLAVLFVLVALETLVSVPKLTWDLAVGGREWMGVALGLIVAAGAAGIVWTGKDRIAALLAAASLRMARIPRRRWLAGVIVAGVALRVAWVLVFPAPYTSDGADYYHLGGHLARGEAYHSAAGYAEWPPGYPLVLALHFAVLGVGSLGVTVANLLLFAGALLVVHALALRLLGEGPARLATLLFALWPNLVAAAGVASKEMVLVFFLPLALLLYLQVDEKPDEKRTPAGRAAAALGAGLALGFSILTQPGVLLMVVIFPVFELLRRTPWLRIAGKLALLAAGMGVVVAPWTLRNYGVFHQPVLVSSNGGSV